MIEILKDVWIAVDKIVYVRKMKAWNGGSDRVVVGLLTAKSTGSCEFEVDCDLIELINRIESHKSCHCK